MDLQYGCSFRVGQDLCENRKKFIRHYHRLVSVATVISVVCLQDYDTTNVSEVMPPCTRVHEENVVA